MTYDAPLADTAFPDALMDDDEAYLRSLRGDMPMKSQDVMARMDKVYSVYVEWRRDKILKEAFDTFMEDTLATRDGQRKEANIFFVTGESGAGKTEAVARVLGRHPSLQPRKASFGVIRPYVSIKLAGYILPRIAAVQIIAASGHPVNAKTGQGDAWSAMPAALRKRRVVLVHIDEVQHLIGGGGGGDGGGSTDDGQQLADAIKGVSISTPWPIAFVLSGLPGIKVLAQKDEQFERRSRWVHFPDVNIDTQRELVTNILVKLSEAAGLGLGAMTETDMPERIAHAANNRYGRICQLVAAAIHQALRAKKTQTELLRGHFALAYANSSRARDDNRMNIFMVDAWQGLEPGAFLDAEKRKGEEADA
ncbi:ATP-binding protein [Methylobacterium sp. WL64]|uniref:ATP-binding protein n=1 Tax=Methylobacterium sp. WL64 TaxID=2603894 RepID=UPI0016508826|nr:ATP-binding protein [Methylobacterium sp. WL64]